jgi:hypothetical protein
VGLKSMIFTTLHRQTDHEWGVLIEGRPSAIVFTISLPLILWQFATGFVAYLFMNVHFYANNFVAHRAERNFL